jgi:hypothetical protein
MATLTPAPAADTENTPALGGRIAGVMAVALLGKGHTSDSVRERASGRQQFGYMWLAIADAMDAIAADPARETAKT